MTLTLPQKLAQSPKQGNSNNILEQKRELAGGHIGGWMFVWSVGGYIGGWMFVWSVSGYVGERMGRLVSSGRIDR